MISIQNLQKKIYINKNLVESKTKQVLKILKLADADLSLVLVDNAQIKKLNKKYLNKNKTTDVLAFSMREGRNIKGNKRLLGDVIVSVQKAKESAKEDKIDFKKELFLYIIHGILHLKGFGDYTKQEMMEINRQQQKILELIWKEKTFQKP